MLRVKIVVEEYGVVVIRFQHFLGGDHSLSDIERIAFETCFEPPVSSLVVVQEKYSDRMALGLNRDESKFTE